MVAVNSSAISDVEYHSWSETMNVVFKNGTSRTYYDVPKSEYEEFIRAESVGRYFNTYIKGKYGSYRPELG